MSRHACGAAARACASASSISGNAGGQRQPRFPLIAGWRRHGHRAELRQYLRIWARRCLVPLVYRPMAPRAVTQRSAQLTNHGPGELPSGRIEQPTLERGQRRYARGRNRRRRTARRVGYSDPLVSPLRRDTVVSYVTPESSSAQRDGSRRYLRSALSPADRRNHVPTTATHWRSVVHELDIPWQGRRIWGATAGMLVSFADLLTGT